jgi:hypothetical protein
VFCYSVGVLRWPRLRPEMARGGSRLTRYQLQISMGEGLLEAIRFAAARDGLAPSQKARQILQQQLYRTMRSQEFLDHCARTGTDAGSQDVRLVDARGIDDDEQ